MLITGLILLFCLILHLVWLGGAHMGVDAAMAAMYSEGTQGSPWVATCQTSPIQIDLTVGVDYWRI